MRRRIKSESLFANDSRSGCIKSKTLAEYSMDLLDDRINALVEEHLKYCKLCNEELRMMQEIDLISDQEYENMAIPEDADRRIFAEIMKRQKKSQKSRKFSKFMKFFQKFKRNN